MIFARTENSSCLGKIKRETLKKSVDKRRKIC